MNGRRQLTRIYSVILAGGSGTRFWPLSRESFPKQFLKLSGKQTMLQRTAELADRINQNGGETTVVGHQQLSDAIKVQLGSRKKTSRYQLLLEPVARNTAAAVGLAAVRIGMNAPNATLVVMPSDHIIKKPRVFLTAVEKAATIASQGYLVMFGVIPNRPETGFGYIQAGPRLRDGTLSKMKAALAVHRFVEKPNRAVAKRYLRKGNYYWNSGIFVFRVDAVLEAIRKHLPRLYRGLMGIEKDLGTGQETETILKIYQKLPAISFDYGIMERVERKRIAVLPVDMGWNDVGSWSALHDMMPKDKNGNVRRGNVIEIGCRSSIIYADKRPVAVLGVEDLVVVDTPDATLVCHKDQVQDVRKVVKVLRDKGAEEHKTPKTVGRPWGNFTVLEGGKGYKIKRIVVNPGARLSLQLHHHRCEHWVVVKGVARVTRNDEEYDVKTEESTFIPKGARHRIANPGRELLEIIEVQNGDYLGEDDIVRFQDDYGRINR